MVHFKKIGFFLGILGVMFVFFVLHNSYVRSTHAQEKESEPSKLLMVWTSGDKEVAEKMVFMYTYNAKKQGWFDEVRFLIWGPSSKLLSEDAELQDYLKKMGNVGVELNACIVCANMYGVTDKLKDLGVDVKGMGMPLTDMLKTGWVTITF